MFFFRISGDNDLTSVSDSNVEKPNPIYQEWFKTHMKYMSV